MPDTAQAGAVDSEPSLRRLPLLLLVLILTAAGLVWGELLLAGPIVFLVSSLGFWRGYVAFCLLWAGLGLFILSVWIRIEPWVREHLFKGLFKNKQEVEARDRQRPQSWRERLVAWPANLGRILGVLAASVLLGPVAAWPVFRLLGFNERGVYSLTIIAAWIFGAIWVPFYGLGVWGLGLSRLF